jgi:hypothetical protein
MSFFKGSPYRRHTNDNDVEAGGSRPGGDLNKDDEESSSYGSPFDITSTKNASIARLRRWRVRFHSHSLYFCFHFYFCQASFVNVMIMDMKLECDSVNFGVVSISFRGLGLFNFKLDLLAMLCNKSLFN